MNMIFIEHYSVCKINAIHSLFSAQMIKAKKIQKLTFMPGSTVHYGNYWTKGCGREANTARASAASECCIRLETKPLSPIIPVVYERKSYINWFVVHMRSSFEFC